MRRLHGFEACSEYRMHSQEIDNVVLEIPSAHKIGRAEDAITEVLLEEDSESDCAALTLMMDRRDDPKTHLGS